MAATRSMATRTSMATCPRRILWATVVDLPGLTLPQPTQQISLPMLHNLAASGQEVTRAWTSATTSAVARPCHFSMYRATAASVAGCPHLLLTTTQFTGPVPAILPFTGPAPPTTEFMDRARAASELSGGVPPESGGIVPAVTESWGAAAAAL